MRGNWRIVALSAGFGLGAWALDAAVDATFFYDRRFLPLLITDVPAHELYVRTLILLSFVAFGLIVARQSSQIEASERDVALSERLLDEANDAIYVLDPETGAIIDVNATACDMLGFTREALRERTVLDIDDQLESIDAFREHAISDPGESVRQLSTQHVRADGTTIPVELTAANVDVDDRGYQIAIARDVSGRQDRLGQIKIIDRVLRHNLHNDMNVVLGMAEEIVERGTPESADHADRIIRTVEDLLATIDKERAVTKFLANPSATGSQDLAAIVRTTVEAVRDRHPHATVTTSLPASATVTVVEQFGAAVEELLDNAVAHTDRDEPAITVRIDAVTPDSGDVTAAAGGVGARSTIALHIMDDGPGIPDMEQRILTDGEEVGPLYHGQGLGLWYVHLLVDHSGGAITYADRDPRGSHITVRLPAARRHGDTGEAGPSDTPGGADANPDADARGSRD